MRGKLGRNSVGSKLSVANSKKLPETALYSVLKSSVVLFLSSNFHES